MITVDLAESSDDVLNPERGYYVAYDLRRAGDASYVRAGGHTLAISIVNLEDYRDSSLDSALLASLAEGFARVRAAGIKIILRFTYNASFSDDAPKARILQHIEQLAPLLQEHADLIAVMQAGFIGAWGEWHGSTNDLDNDADRGEILDALLTALPTSRGVQVRTPMYKDAYVPGGPLAATEAYDGSPRARLGHHNDCFLASDSDLGTFASPVEQWQDYVENDGRYTAIGGETCIVYEPRVECASALATMEEQHWSYLNRQYNVNVLQVWEEQGCAGEIEQRLGYRFVAKRVTLNEAVAPGGELAVEIELRNRGFAAPFNHRPVELVLTNGAVRHVVRLAGADARRWAAGEAPRLAARLRIPADVAPGTYTLALRLPDESPRLADDPRYAIRLANADAWDEATGDNVLTRALVIDPAAPGPRDPGATALVEL